MDKSTIDIPNFMDFKKDMRDQRKQFILLVIPKKTNLSLHF